MKKFTRFFTFIFLSSTTFAQNVAPQIEFYNIANASSYSGIFRGVRSVNSFYTLNTAAGGISNWLYLQKYSNEKMLWSKELVNCFGFGCTGYETKIFASQDDGVFLQVQNTLRQFDSNGNQKWSRNITYNLINASATLAGGFHIYTLEGTTKRIERVKADGLSEWSFNVGTFDVADIQTTSDDGFVITGINGTRKYSSAGVLQWNISLGGNQILIIDPLNMYITGSQGAVKMNVSNGNTIWSYNLSGIRDAKIGKDNSLVLLTLSSLNKIKSDGVLEWSNTNFGGIQLAITQDGHYSVSQNIGNGKVIKITPENRLFWQKSFRNINVGGNGLNLFPASDNGLFIIGNIAQQISTNIMLKVAPTDTTCRYKPTFTASGPLNACKVGSNRFSDNNLERIGGVLSDDFITTWQKNGIDIPNSNSPILNANTSGNYTFKVTQGNCVATSEPANFRILNENPPNITTESNKLCNGKSLKLTGSGCVGNLVWSTGGRGTTISVSPISNTAYNAFCEANYTENGVSKTCTSDQSNVLNIEVSPQTEMKVSNISGKNIICNDEVTTLLATVSGGNLPYNYKWIKDDKEIPNAVSNSLSANNTGKYIIQVNDSYGCNANSAVFTIEKSNLKANITGEREFCIGKSTTLQVNPTEGIGKYQISWKKNDAEVSKEKSLTITSGGNYSVVVTDSLNCQVSLQNIVITEKGTGIVANITPIGATSIFEPDSVTLNATTGAGYAYQWKKDNNIISNATKSVYYVKQTGNYAVEVNREGCSVLSSPVLVTVNKPLANELSENEFEVILFPNPTSDNLKLDLPTGITFKEAVFFTLDGKEIMKTNRLSENNTLNISQLQKAIYNISIETTKGKVVRKIVLE